MLGGQRWIVLVALLLIVPSVPLTTGAGPSVPAPLELAGPSPSVGDRAAVADGMLDDLDPVNHVIVRFDTREAMHSVGLAAEGGPASGSLDGVDVRYTFESLPAAYVLADGEAVRTLASLEEVRYIEPADEPIDFDLDTATLATLAREVWDPAADNPHVAGDPDPIQVSGETIDGTGIGIAILDTGIDTTHPDLPAPDKVVRSFLATPGGVTEAPYAAPLDPHGTAVGGTAAGTGQASGGSHAGAAPGASLYSFAVHHATIEQRTRFGLQGDGVSLYPAIAMDWIAEHGDEQDPPIEVVNNAWHCRNPECRESVGEQSIHAQLARGLVDQGVTVTWAFGNNPATWNPEATLPIQGVIGVTSTTDIDLGFRDGCKSDFSSEGHALDPSTWPDIAAPGESIESPAALHLGTQTHQPGVDAYSVSSGTSLAAAHVAGVVSMMLQANPDLTPGEIEWILEETATNPPEALCEAPYNKGDPTHPTSAANHEVGHGLIDAYAAVETAIGFDSIPETDETALDPDESFLEPEHRSDRDAVEVQQRLYLEGADGLSTLRPTGSEASSESFAANEHATFTSDPFEAPASWTGIDSSLWLTVDTEELSRHWAVVSNVEIVFRVEQVNPDGVLKDAVTLTTPFVDAFTGRVVERPFVQAFDTSLDIEPGDRIRADLTVQVDGIGGSGVDVTSWELHWGSTSYPSHVGLGVQAPDAPGTYRACRNSAPDDCAWIDADHPSSLTRLPVGTHQIEWEGPGGSGAQMVAHGGIVLDGCTVPAEEEWGRCVARIHSPPAGRLGPVACEIVDPSGPIEGHGRCVAFRGN